VIAGAGAAVRLSLLVLVAVVAQVSGLASIRVLGSVADIIPLVVAAVGLWGGATAGAGTGFAAGLLFDAALGHNLGVSSLVLTTVGYGTGRFGEVRDPAHGLIAIPVGAGATLGYLTAYGFVSFMLEIDAAVSALVFRDAVVTTLLNALLAIPVFGIVKRILRPVLTSEPGGRRRRSEPRATGPLGLRGLEV
jgi:rod shape-determining protein MreD